MPRRTSAVISVLPLPIIRRPQTLCSTRVSSRIAIFTAQSAHTYVFQYNNRRKTKNSYRIRDVFRRGVTRLRRDGVPHVSRRIPKILYTIYIKKNSVSIQRTYRKAFSFLLSLKNYVVQTFALTYCAVRIEASFWKSSVALATVSREIPVISS